MDADANQPVDADPSAILHRASEKQAERAAMESELQARQRWAEKAVLVWEPLRYFAPIKATPAGQPLVHRNSPEYCERFAERILAFVAELPALDRADRLTSISPGDDSKQYAVAVFRKAADDESAAVVSLLIDAAEHSDFWPSVWDWLRHGLPEEILGDACPNCGGLRKLEDWDRWCEKCRRLGELAWILVEWRTNPPSLRHIQGIVVFERLLCDVFNCKTVTSSTLDELEEFLDRAVCRDDETLRQSRERWLRQMSLGEAVVLLEEAKAKQGDKPPSAQPPVTTEPNLQSDSEAIGPKKAKMNPPQRSWTQADLDGAIQEYKAERASTYNDLVAAVSRRQAGAMKKAREIYGRNAIARALGVKARAMVTKSAAWQTIADELGLRGPSVKDRPSKQKRIGMEIALEEHAIKANADEVDPLVRNETIDLIRRSMEPEPAEATIEKLQRGKLMDDEARELVTLSIAQKQDDRVHRVRQAP